MNYEELSHLRDVMEKEGYGLRTYDLRGWKLSYSYKGQNYTVDKDKAELKRTYGVDFVRHSA